MFAAGDRSSSTQVSSPGSAGLEWSLRNQQTIERIAMVAWQVMHMSGPCAAAPDFA
jgi:hypothetical protein